YTGEVEGVIAEQLCGTNGFGYDPLFFLPEFGLTMAEIPAEKKNEISHRANAIKQLEKDLAEVVEKVTKK
ncbi:TPA: non-canonical purine NTP pyrophosphatase, partial [Listeria monocytogenes]|nr:non-canonical purine NTP pyrophosphatase [Listeria monocytogenes]